MEALLTAFVAAGLSEWGDKTQLLAALLVARTGKPGAVLGGIALAAVAGSALAAFGGSLLQDMISLRAASLLVALALLFAGAGGLFRSKPPEVGKGLRYGVFATAAGSAFVHEFGDKSQFLTAALTAQYDQPILTALGAAAGVIVVALPALMLGDRLSLAMPVNGLRVGASVTLLLASFLVGIHALRLI